MAVIVNNHPSGPVRFLLSPTTQTMDSMRHLSTSLPATTRRRQDQPELLADFKAAALSVTNLYKTAAALKDKARAAGYQDALDDVLVFLDKENLGLMDGEGWRVRQWATERLVDDGLQRQQAAVSDEEEDGVAQEARRSSSPSVQRKPPPVPMPVSSSELEEASPRRTAVSEPPQQHPHSRARTPTPTLPSRDDFTFRSTHAYPTNHDRESSNTMDLDNGTASSSPSTTETVRIIQRPTNRARHTNHNRRGNTTGSATVNLNLGAGAGSKRKMPYPDFFDISGSNLDGQDGGGGGGGNGGGRGGKRGRHA